MTIPASHRNVAWLALLALLVMAPAVAGPGAIVATLAALDGGRDHHVSIQRDAGHDDFVFCHDSREEADSAGPSFAASDCADDHRLHAANAESLTSRDDVAHLLQDAPLAVVASPHATIATPSRDALPESGPATLVAHRHHRTVVLRI